MCSFRHRFRNLLAWNKAVTCKRKSRRVAATDDAGRSRCVLISPFRVVSVPRSIAPYCTVAKMLFSSSKFLFLVLLLAPSIQLMSNRGFVRAEQDEIADDDEEEVQEEEEGGVDDDEAEVEDDEAEVEEDGDSEAATTEEEAAPLTAHPDTETAVLFSTGEDAELVAGKLFTSYIHFANTGSKNFIMTGITGSFRYPQDFSYVIQNFTDKPLNKMIDAGKEGSFMYEFMAAEMAAGRPFGLVLSLNYKDTEDNLYMDTVYNKTVTVQENEEGVDAETFFMYVVLAALVGLLGFGMYHLMSTKGKRTRRHAAPSTPVETGTSEGNVDYTWIPRETLNSMNKGSPSPRRSPRKRGGKRAPANEAE